MFDTVLGVPIHPLVVHAVVVLAPLTVLLMLLFATWERFRAWSGPLTAIVATVTLVLSPVATQSGETLERRLPGSEAIHEHAELGDTMPWVLLAATAVAWLMWWYWRRDRAAGSGPGGRVSRSGFTRALAAVGIVAAIGLGVDVALVGHSGAQAVWGQVGSQPAPAGGEHDD